MSSWKEYKLGDIAKNASRRFDFSKHSNVIFINTGDVLNNQFLHKDYSIAEGLPGQAKKAIQKGDILYSEIRPGNGRYLLVGNGVDDYVVSTKFMVIESNREVILPEFLFLLLISNEATEYFKVIAESRSGTFPQITFDSISHYELRIPSKDIQQSIVDNIFALDKKIQLNTQINQTLEQIAQTIFKSWFIDFDPVHAKAEALANGQTAEQATQAAMAVISGKNTQELHRLQTANPEQYQQLWEIADAFPSGVDEEGVPWGWESKKVGEVAKFIKGKKPKLISSEPDDGFLPHILMASLSGKYTEYAQIDKSIVCNIFDTLILMDGAASGKITIGHKGVIGSTFAKMELSENKYWALFNQFMFSKEQDIQANTTGTSIPHTDKARVLDYEVVVPCDVVLNYFTEMYKSILCSSLNQRKNSFVLENVRDLLLPKLLSGEIHL